MALSGDGNTALIGGPEEETEDGGPGRGGVLVFTLSGSTWTQQAELIGEGDDGDFGASVALSSDGNTALIGSPGANFGEPGGQHGVAYVLTRSGTTWTHQETFTCSEAIEVCAEGYEFGASVALSSDGNTALISGPFARESSAAFVFTHSGSVWTQQGPVLLATGRRQPVALSADGNTALIGDTVFTRSGSTWTQQAQLSVEGEQRRVALSADGNTALIGGAVFTRLGSTWTQEAQLPVSGGVAVALSGDGNTALIGSPRENAARVFVSVPVVVTGAASSITRTSATLSATVNPYGVEVSECKLEYGPTASYGASAKCLSLPGSGTSPVEVSAPVTGLQ